MDQSAGAIGDNKISVARDCTRTSSNTTFEDAQIEHKGMFSLHLPRLTPAPSSLEFAGALIIALREAAETTGLPTIID